MNIHENIKKKIDYFISENKIPHIVFHGSSGSGKRSVLEYLIMNIYKTRMTKELNIERVLNLLLRQKEVKLDQYLAI